MEEMLVSSAAGFKYLSMLDGYSEYNKTSLLMKMYPKQNFVAQVPRVLSEISLVQETHGNTNIPTSEQYQDRCYNI